MNSEIVFTFEGSHQAIAAERSLLAAGLGVRAMPLPSQIAEGCGICLRVGEDESKRALEVLDADKLSPKAVWLKQSNGFFTVVHKS